MVLRKCDHFPGFKARKVIICCFLQPMVESTIEIITNDYSGLPRVYPGFSKPRVFLADYFCIPPTLI